MYASLLYIRAKDNLIQLLGICFQSNYSILHLDIPDNPSKPCLSCTKQWCLNQNLPICAGASLGDTDPDTASGKEGDVEARCFRKLFPLLVLLKAYLTRYTLYSRTRFTTRPTCGYPVPVNSFRATPWSRDQKPDGKSRFRCGHPMVDRSQVVGG